MKPFILFRSVVDDARVAVAPAHVVTAKDDGHQTVELALVTNETLCVHGDFEQTVGALSAERAVDMVTDLRAVERAAQVIQLLGYAEVGRLPIDKIAQALGLTETEGGWTVGHYSHVAGALRGLEVRLHVRTP